MIYKIEVVSLFIGIVFLNGGNCVYREGTCHSVKMTSSNAEQFYTGTWHEIKTTAHNFEDTEGCGVFTFHKYPESLVSVHYNDDATDFAEIGYILHPEQFLSLRFPGDYSDSQIHVLETDGVNYAVIYSCSQESSSTVNERLWILSRNKDLSTSLQGAAETVIENQGLADEVLKFTKSCRKRVTRATFKTCYRVQPMEDLFVDRFFNWRWLEKNRTISTLGNTTECGIFWYEHAPALPGDPQLVILDHRYPQSDQDYVMAGNATTKGKITTAAIQFPGDTGFSTYSVLWTDYECALIYTCVEENGEAKERAWILSRYPNITDECWLGINKNIDDQNVFGDGDFRARLTQAGSESCEDIKISNACYDVRSKQNLEPDRFFKGSWNQIWRSHNHIEDGDECGSLEFRTYNATHNPKRRIVITYNYPGGKQIKATGSVLPEDNEINIQVLYSNIKTKTKSKYTVVDTDYENYAVVYSCSQTTTSKKDEALWILSRSSTVSNRANQVVNADGYLRRLSHNRVTC